MLLYEALLQLNFLFFRCAPYEIVLKGWVAYETVLFCQTHQTIYTFFDSNDYESFEQISFLASNTNKRAGFKNIAYDFSHCNYIWRDLEWKFNQKHDEWLQLSNATLYVFFSSW